MRAIKDENGEIVVEATVIVTLSLFVVFILLNFALFTYQKINITVSANQAATDVANIFGRQASEPFYGYFNKDYYSVRKKYRYFDSELKNAQARKAEWYASYLVQRTENPLSPERRTDFTDITAKIVKTGLGTNQIQVTVKRKYPALAVDPMRFFGLDTEYEYEATGIAQCCDIIDMINYNGFYAEVKKRLAKGTVSESVAGMVESFLHLFDERKSE